MPQSLRSRLLVFFLLPALAFFAVAGYAGFSVTRGILDDELGRSLSQVAGAAASQLNPRLVLQIEPGDDGAGAARRGGGAHRAGAGAAAAALDGRGAANRARRPVDAGAAGAAARDRRARPRAGGDAQGSGEPRPAIEDDARRGGARGP